MVRPARGRAGRGRRHDRGRRAEPVRLRTGPRAANPGRAAPLLAAALLAGCGAGPLPSSPRGDGAYVPPPGPGWARVAPRDAGFDRGRLAAAVAWAEGHESDFGPDLEASLGARLRGEPYPEVLGPLRSRGPASGTLLRGGRIVAEWGDPERVDMTFSVTKSVLSTVAGLAFDAGLIDDLDAPVRASVPDSLFAGRNAPITWHMLLQQRSEWEGSLWGKPDVADRREGRDRTLRPPGTFWEYNDVRVNLAALALLHVWGRPLPEVLAERVMEPIGASDAWRWHGYRTSWTEVGGRRVQSVSGGGHWGGGLFVSTRDLARLGLLYLRGGRWGGRRILSDGWIARATAPADIRPAYGYMIWLNTGRDLYPSAPASSWFFLGGGSNVVWIDREHDLVAVVRWIDPGAVDGFIARVLDALEG